MAIKGLGRRLYQGLIEPKSTDEDNRRRERILNIVLVGSLGMLAVFDGLLFYYTLAEGSAYSQMSTAGFSIIVLFFLLLYLLSRRGFFAAAAYLLVAAYFVSVSYAAYVWGANLPAALLGYALLIVIASVLINARFGFIIAAAITVFIITLWHFQFYGLLPLIEKAPPNNSDAFVFSILFFLLTTVAWLSNREIEKSLARARRSERELKEERDSLEEKVDARTRELREIQLEKIDHLYRFAEFGQLASGLFHDLLNLLNVVSLRAERDRAMGDAQKAGLESAFSIQREIERFREAVRKQLSHDDQTEIFSLAEGVTRAVQLLAYQAKRSGVRLAFDYDVGQPFEYFGSPLKFHQVAINLILNAIESFDGVQTLAYGRRITICLECASGQVTFQVQDNGVGIPAPLQTKIFDPFFTMKNSGEGMGIGLAITKRIVENDFGGTISVSSGKEKGTVFTVRFPIDYEAV